MLNLKRILWINLILLFSIETISAQNLYLKQSNESGVYKNGEPIQLKALISKHLSDSIFFSIRRNYQQIAEKRRFVNTGDTLTLFLEPAKGPSSIIFEITTKKDTVSIGLVIEPEKFTVSTSRPADFDTYWAEEKKQLAALPIQIKSNEIAEIEKGYSIFNMEINCTGPKPVRGYYAKPQNARSGSLPIVLFVHAAGVSGNWCRSEPAIALRYAKMGNGAICFDLNAHGMLTAQSDTYYQELEKGELLNYSQTGLEDRSTVYFRGMYLRLLRTIEFLTQQPEWDGKRILVIGESQGGGQALAAAGLDKRVSAVVASVPAMCDWGRTLLNSKGGWPNPFGTKNDQAKMLLSLPYYDAAHLLKGSKATIVTEIGLIDFTCSSESIYAAINQSEGEKKVFAVPYRAHHMLQPVHKEEWENAVTKPKEAFIRAFLK